jgi:predicted O-methyltransferase YrrM
MSTRTISVDDRLYEYILRVSLREPEVLRRLREETAKMPGAGMQLSPEQGQLMRFLVEALGVRKAVEVGVFTGYSSTCIALGMPPDGRLVACDVNEDWTAIARRCWREAGVEGRIELRIGEAIRTLDALLADGGAGAFDFAFVDADKENMDGYYERCLRLLRAGGIVAFDNVLWAGRVADPSDRSDSTAAIRALNDKLHADERVFLTLIPIGDGLTLARKR